MWCCVVGSLPYFADGIRKGKRAPRARRLKRAKSNPTVEDEDVVRVFDVVLFKFSFCMDRHLAGVRL